MELECNLGGMNDVIASKRSSLIPILIETMMFLKLNMSPIPNNLAYVAESPIWNTLIPSRFELLDDVDDSDDYENEEDDDNDNDDDDYLSPMPIESEEADYTC